MDETSLLQHYLLTSGKKFTPQKHLGICFPVFSLVHFLNGMMFLTDGNIYKVDTANSITAYKGQVE